MIHTIKPLDLAVSVITREALGGPDTNRILAFRDGKVMPLDTGAMGDAQDLMPEDRDESLARIKPVRKLTGFFVSMRSRFPIS